MSGKIIVKSYERKREWCIERGYRTRIHSYALKEWLEETTKHKKRIPLLKTKKEIWWFLSGFIDSEGTIKRNSGGSDTNVRIEAAQKGDQILNQIRTYAFDCR